MTQGSHPENNTHRRIPVNMLPIDQNKLNLITLNPTRFGDLGLFCHDLPGIGGRLKTVPEDFEVEEIPVYEPSGEGEHLFLWVEKRGVSSDQMIKALALGLDMSARDIGIAGKKDKNAVTRQFVSIPAKLADRVDRFQDDKITVLSSRTHTNKLSTGHNHGNRFKVVVRDLSNPDPDLIQQITDRIHDVGFPNFYGTQRFGVDGDTAEIGFKFLKGEEDSLSKQWRVRSRKKFVISAAQSFLFNRYLMRRMLDRGTDKLMSGDVVFKTTGGIFRVEDLEVEQKRFEANEIVPAGPIFGKKTYQSAGEALEFENSILAEAGIERAVFSDFGKLMLGSRRAIYCRPEGLSCELSGNDLLIEFQLPSGSYATVLLAAYMQPPLG